MENPCCLFHKPNLSTLSQQLVAHFFVSLLRHEVTTVTDALSSLNGLFLQNLFKGQKVSISIKGGSFCSIYIYIYVTGEKYNFKQYRWQLIFFFFFFGLLGMSCALKSQFGLYLSQPPLICNNEYISQKQKNKNKHPWGEALNIAGWEQQGKICKLVTLG